MNIVKTIPYILIERLYACLCFFVSKIVFQRSSTNELITSHVMIKIFF